MRLLPVLLVGLLALACERREPALPGEQLNVVLIVTDDQRADTLWAMPLLQEHFSSDTAHFNRAVVANPLCVPSRTCLLSGGFDSKDIGALTNLEPNGGMPAFDDSLTLPVVLMQAGYTTALVGKYLNGYADYPDYVPPGWSLWDTIIDHTPMDDWWGTRGSSGLEPGTAESVLGSQYYTEYQQDVALDFITSAQEPFFLYLSSVAPHQGTEPAPQDAYLFEDYTWRGPSYNEADISDKPAWLRAENRLTVQERDNLDENVREQLRSLQAVDRMVAEVMGELATRGMLERTVVIFTADNGVHWGEHRVEAKGLPYEPSIRVPLLITGAGVESSTRDKLVSAIHDVPATVLEAAGVEGYTQGMGLLREEREESFTSRDRLLLEGYSPPNPVYAGFVSERFKYVEWATGENELYDLTQDPDELTNLAQSPPQDLDLEEFHTWVQENRGLAILNQRLPAGDIGESYEAQIETWGGTPPLQWTAEELPRGLSLSQDGLLSGILKAPGRAVMTVSDSSVSPWNGRNQSFTGVFEIEVDAK